MNTRLLTCHKLQAHLAFASIKGKRKDKIEIIKQRIKIFKRKDDGLDLNKVELYFDENLEDVLTQIRLKLRKMLGK